MKSIFIESPLKKEAKIEPWHDFTAKLRQPSLFPRIKKYISWQRARRKAKAEGSALPEMPKSLLAPISINLDLTTACNFRCGHCIDQAILNRGVNYDYGKLVASLESMIKYGLRSVILIGGGEPTIYPKFREVVRFLKERSIQLAIVSNGSRNNVICEVAECFSDKDWVRFSLDAGSNKTFIKMHRPRRAITLEEICGWVPLIREKNPNLSVGFSFVIVWERVGYESENEIVPNIEEIVMATELARQYKFNYISIKPFLTRRPEGSEIMDTAAVEDFNCTIARIREAVKEAKTYETEDFRVIESTNLRALEQNIWHDFTCQPPVCHMQVFRQVLSPLGLFNCPAYRGAEKAHIAAKDVYSGKSELETTKKAIEAILDRFDASHACREITCFYNLANWWIEKAVRGEIAPSEFKELEERGDYFL